MGKSRSSRRRRSSRRSRSQYGYFGKFGSDANMAWKAAKMASKALAMLNTEEKTFSVSASRTPTVATAAVDPLFYPAQGTSQSERIGNDAKVTSLAMRAHVSLDPLSTTTFETVRLLLVLDHQSNGVQALLTEVLQNNSIIALRALGQSKRFTVLNDKTINLYSQSKPSAMIEIYHKLDYKPQFNTNTGTVADIQKNNIFLILMSSHTGVHPPTFIYNNRMRFIDN